MRTMLFVCLAVSCFGQIEPEGSQVFSYFPHLVDGGPASQRWTTRLTFTNPNSSFPVAVAVQFYRNDGGPLALNFGSGAQTSLGFTIPPQGSTSIVSAAASASTAEGWAIAASTLPVQGVIQFRYSVNGLPQQEVSAQATPASQFFRSPATRESGVAVANIYNNASLRAIVTAISSGGQSLGSATVSVPALGHQSFNLGTLFPSLASTFRGTVTVAPSNGSDYFVVWTLNGEGALSSYPPAGSAWPVSHYERIWKVWTKILNVAAAQFPQLAAAPPKLVVDYSTGQINALANPTTNEVYIFINLAELISDSESELAFVVGHELGHIIQARRNGLFLVPTNAEQDADQYGMLLGLISGYDPYAAAGALAKLSMASGDASLVSQLFDNYVASLGLDLHGSFNQRIALIFTNMQQLCLSLKSFCDDYKRLVHPHLPPLVPLVRGGTPSQ